MSPEQRAARLRHGWFAEDSPVADDFERDMARALRAERNAALERAAKHIMDIYPNCLAVAESVRSLKTRAPKRKAGRA